MSPRRFTPHKSSVLVAAFLFTLLMFASSLFSGKNYKEDINGDGATNISDAIALLLLQRNSPEDPSCDYNGDNAANISDIISLLLTIRSGNLTPLDTGNSTGETIAGIEMVSIPAGSFQRGDDSYFFPIQTISVSAFQIGKYEITQSQYESVTGINPSHFVGNPDHPVEKVGWYDAARFCNLLSESAGLATCYDTTTWVCDFSKDGFRLPTEAEWVYACRAGTTTLYYTGDTEADLDRAAWYSENSLSGTQAVGQKEPNDFGLYDMLGNVTEWLNDNFEFFYYQDCPLNDPRGPDEVATPSKVIMGGAWQSVASVCNVGKTVFSTPNANTVWTYGFRVARYSSN